MLKMIILPRQARDKHRDSSKQTIVFFATLELGELLEPYATESLYMCCCPEPYLPCTLSERDSTYGKQPFGAIFALQTIDLLRQARDKHSKSRHKRPSPAGATSPSGATSCHSAEVSPRRTTSASPCSGEKTPLSVFTHFTFLVFVPSLSG